MAAIAESIEKIYIREVSVSAYIIPTDEEESDGTLKWNSTTLILIQIGAGGKNGIGYTYADASAALLIERTLKKIIIGKNAMDIPSITGQLIEHIRNNGQAGIAMMAVSAIDSALWDLKAKILNLPLSSLLGRVRNEMPIYYSGGFTSYNSARLQKQLAGWAAHGAKQVKIKIGRQPDKDAERVKLARQVIGTDVQLFVDANGAYTVRQAIDKAIDFSEFDIRWFEEPVMADNLSGLNFIRSHVPAPVNIAAGEYGYNLPYFEKMLLAGAVDVLQADATRCGGITGFLKAAHLAEAFQIPFSSHCAPSLHMHVALSLPNFYIAEYFYDHYRIEQMLFDGVALPASGVLKPDLNRTGLGIEFKYQDAQEYKI